MGDKHQKETRISTNRSIADLFTDKMSLKTFATSRILKHNTIIKCTNMQENRPLRYQIRSSKTQTCLISNVKCLAMLLKIRLQHTIPRKVNLTSLTRLHEGVNRQTCVFVVRTSDVAQMHLRDFPCLKTAPMQSGYATRS